MDLYLIVKTLHIVSATLLFGIGIGIAGFMLLSHFTTNLHEKHFAARSAVLADALITAPAAVLQPLTGAWLIWQGGYDWSETWLILSFFLYGLAALCWLPVVWIQVQLRKMLAAALASREDLPDRYHRLFQVWFVLGWPAFIALLTIFFLMVFKPA